jgi:predicted transposase/invertase (TIGR01784 family)
MIEFDETTYVSLTNDLLFHMVFTRNAEALKGLLSVLLNISESDILRIEVLNPMQYSDVIDSKLTVLDLKVHMNDNTFVHVEMQVRRFKYWTNRTVGYACRQIADQIHADFDYGKLEPVIQISIMDYSFS